MEKIINELYTIEEKANRILERATNEKKTLQTNLDHDLEALDNNIATTSFEKLKTLQDNMDKELAIEKETLELKCSQKIETLENYFTNNHDVLVNEVISHIIGA